MRFRAVKNGAIVGAIGGVILSITNGTPMWDSIWGCAVFGAFLGVVLRAFYRRYF
jgi:uncharacterized membrane protein